MRNLDGATLPPYEDPGPFLNGEEPDHGDPNEDTLEEEW